MSASVIFRTAAPIQVSDFRHAARADAGPARLGVRNAEGQTWRDEVDVIVVGTGGAGFAAACAAAAAGSSVLMLERAQVWGGTTRASGGCVFICNNPWMQRQGLADPRPEALSYLARCKSSLDYDPDSPTLGLTVLAWQLLERFYDEGSRVVQRLTEQGVIQLGTTLIALSDQPMADYCAHYAEDAAPRGRCLKPLLPDGRVGVGSDLIRLRHDFATQRGVRIELATRVLELVRNPGGRIEGVVGESLTGEEFLVASRQAVIFGTGGFTHDPELRSQFLRGPDTLVALSEQGVDGMAMGFVDYAEELERFDEPNSAAACSRAPQVMLNNAPVSSMATSAAAIRTAFVKGSPVLVTREENRKGGAHGRIH